MKQWDAMSRRYYDTTENVDHAVFNNGEWMSVGYNGRHDVRYVNRMWEVAFYIPCYGYCRTGHYHSARAAKAAITRFDNVL